MTNHGICPKCNGTGRMNAQDTPYKAMYPNYDKDTDTLPCNNCGAQYMYGTPTGKVLLNKQNVPCLHEYTESNIGRCLTQYICKHCNDRYIVDSGD